MPKTVGLPVETMVLLDVLRKQRNLSDYEGDAIAQGAVDECLKQAQALLVLVKAWMAEHRPDLG
ncbi:hypothetical protein [Chitinimonas sp. BJB300]|uniref:hypothetical protein n=1 Tax=Chitinimonas sp. BJB300 TaxID=1559339 RepID=UPI000C0DA6B9|nr:hypothetical protein [Chitinimonas sp. BJB300]PHV10963.1 hypothetical protein CSQ89_13460 [Chitinimonas sp. BJB300]TSJ89898.1 hypothetical protein FG002_006760 [Chitinimonas sp. BJB300]